MKLNPIFLALMALSFLSAFVLPVQYTNPARGEVGLLFAPVSKPARLLADVIARRLNPPLIVDDGSPLSPRPDATVLEENRALRMRLASLTIRFEQLSDLNADRQLVGNIRPLCKPVSVTGVDASGIRDSLLLGSSSLAGLSDNQPVLYAPQALAGRIMRAGLGGPQVRLVTDPGFAETGRILQYRTDPDGSIQAVPIENLQPLVQGVGHGAMAIRSTISMQQVATLGIHAKDLVVLDDRDWPDNVQGTSIGRIAAIRAQPNAPLFADIRIEPFTDLLKLREVMVMVK